MVNVTELVKWCDFAASCQSGERARRCSPHRPEQQDFLRSGRPAPRDPQMSAARR